MKKYDRCATCAHNLNKCGLDCECQCTGADRTKTDDDGTVYITACSDYKKDTADYIVTFEDAHADIWGDKRQRSITVPGDSVVMTIDNINFYGLHFIGAQKIPANKYQVITYSPDAGADERLQYSAASDAKGAARRYIKTGYATAALVYDLAAGRIVCTFGDFPQSARPTER